MQFTPCFFPSSREFRRPQPSATIGLRSTPMPPSISTSTTSPGFIHKGGLRAKPTPSGVPVAITSPATNGVQSEQYEIRVGNVGDQIVDPGVLDLPAVEPRHQMQPRRVGNLVRGADLRPEAARRV